jgi:hypothetical protein
MPTALKGVVGIFTVLLRAFRAVLRSTFTTSRHTRCIEATAYCVIAHTGKILYTPTTNQNHTVLLQVVALSTYVR